MSVPQGRTVRDQLEAWVAGQPGPRRESALRLAGLEELYSMIKVDGELNKRVQFSLQSPKIQKKLTAVEIDVDTTWVDMAKKAADPTKDWFPTVTTRLHVVGLLRPYVEKIGGTDQLSRLFFNGKDLDSLFLQPPKSRMPGFETVVAILKFCIENARSGGERSPWTSETLFFMEGQWDVFGRGKMPFPELRGKKEFITWITGLIPHERVDHIAKALNDALGKPIFSSNLLIDWRKGSLPSRSKFADLLRGIKQAFPEWLPAEFRSTDSQAEVARQVPTPMDVHVPEQLREEPKEAPASIEEILTHGLERIIQELRNAQKVREQAPVVVVQKTQQPSPPATDKEDPGEVVHGLRFVLTADSFKRAEVFSLAEVEDTQRLIEELSRRQALMNSMTLENKRAVLRRLKPAYNELFVQMRHMDASKEDLPAMFQEMKIVAAAMSGDDLDEITS